MKTETTVKTNIKKRLALTFGIAGLILLIPLIAMQFTNEVNWNFTDFLIMGILLTLTGLAIEIVTRKVKSTYWKIGITILIVLVLLLIWAELAVGIFGSPFAGS